MSKMVSMLAKDIAKTLPSINTIPGAYRSGINESRIPPFDNGGVNITPSVYRSEVNEDRISLKGGRVPVKMDTPEQQKAGVTIVMNNPTFQDLETQTATFAEMARYISQNEFEPTLIKNYENDGASRKLIRGGT